MIMLCHAVRRGIHESRSRSGEEQNRRFKSTCIGASFSRFFDLAVDIFACAHFRTSLFARARAHSRDFCRTCESKAMRRQFHDHSHVFFVVTLHHFSKSCCFSSQKQGFRFLAPCVALNFGIAVVTCALARARSKVLQEVLICALARARSEVRKCAHAKMSTARSENLENDAPIQVLLKPRFCSSPEPEHDS